MTINNLIEAKKRAKQLSDLLDQYSHEYYVLDQPTINDNVYDSLNNELKAIEKAYPELVTPDSPTQRVGGKALEKFEKSQHITPMLSLSDVFDYDEIRNWEARNIKILGVKTLDYFCELKIDGISVMLTYENGVFTQGATRGDGIIGENVTQNMRTISSIPIKLKKEQKGRIDVRGEVFMPKKTFETLNNNQIKKGLKAFANPRNLAAGSVRQLDPYVTAKRGLDSYIYDIYVDLGIKTHEEKHKIINRFGFKTSQYVKYCRNIDEVVDYCQYWCDKRNNLEFLVDGIVIIVNNNRFFNNLGIVGKAPRGSVAYKFAAEQTTTVIEDIRVNVGRTGAITPFAVMKPVKIAGSTVSRATLHNEDEIKRKDIKIGDTVVLQKAGDIIPEIIGPIVELRTGVEKAFKMPKLCPICGNAINKPEGEAVARCTNKKCFAIEKEQIIHFTAKDAFNIDGLGEKIIEQLLNESLISDAADLYALEIGDLIFLEHFADKSAEKLIEAIQQKKIVTFSRFLYSLGIRHVGATTASALSATIKNIDSLQKMTVEDLSQVEGVGIVIAKSIYDWFRERKNIELLDKFVKFGVGYKKIKPQDKLSGLTFVITGSLTKKSREETEETIRSLGGKASSSVSKETDYLVAGSGPGSKLNKAENLGIKIISEEDLYKIL